MKPTVLIAALSLLATPALAQDAASAPSALPVQEVTLFSSGVSYVQRGGEVDGDASVPLLFRTAQINDILKSLVLIDENGHVQPATYAAHDPISHTLQAFAVDVTQNLTQEQILNQLRGAAVSVETANKGKLSGQIVGVEERQVAGDDGKPITVPFLNLLTDDGLTSVRLDAEKSVKLLDERLNREFREALGLLASGSDEQRRQVTLHFSGAGKRQVRVGYVSEAPLWKMSYRLLLGGVEKGQVGAKPYLQGWALVENTTEEDWKGIRLSLVSGRPVSFIEDLYQPLYLPRPVVAPDVVASPYPQLHEGNLQEQQKALAQWRVADDVSNQTVNLDMEGASLYSALSQLLAQVKANFSADPSLKQVQVTAHVRDVPFRVALETLLKSSGLPLTYQVENGVYSLVPKREDTTAEPSPVDEGPPTHGYPGSSGFPGMSRLGASTKLPPGIDSLIAVPGDNSFVVYERSVVAQAQGQSAGELFEYNIDTPVTLPRQQAAMIPVVTKDIDGEKVLLYNADTDARFPLNAVRIKNTTGLHLKGGPLTLFDDGVYAGDARMEDIPPGDTRLVSYAVDLSVEGERQSPAPSTVQTTFSLKHGVLTITRIEKQETNYTFKSKAEKPRIVLVEHPFQADYKLITPEKATERTASVYRFAVTVPAGKSQTLKVVTQRPLSEAVAVLSTDINEMIAYANHKEISPQLGQTLKEVVQRRQRVADLMAQTANREAQIKSIGDDQDRIRKNMAALDKSSTLYRRYSGELNDQETKLQNLRQEAQRLSNQAATAQEDLQAFVDKVTVAE